MNEEGEYFTDDDFEAQEDETNKKDKKITYKDVIRRDVQQKLKDGGEADSGSDEESQTDLFKKGSKGKETIAEE